jgi:hypothetical protein
MPTYKLEIYAFIGDNFLFGQKMLASCDTYKLIYAIAGTLTIGFVK